MLTFLALSQLALAGCAESEDESAQPVAGTFAVSGTGGSAAQAPSSGAGQGGSGGVLSTGGTPAAGGSGANDAGVADAMASEPIAADASQGERDAGTQQDASDPCVKGTVSGSQVVFVGDSFLAAPTSNIAFELEALMQASGSTAYSATPRFRQLVGTTMEQIVAQYDTEHELDPDIKVVIANGGGNDVLVTDRSCLLEAPPSNAGCTATIENALEHARKLMEKAEADGVEHLVYFFYPHEPTFGLFQGDAPTINESLDYTEPMARALCEGSPICTFVSLSEAAGDSPGSGYVDRGYHDLDGTHPSPAGSKFFAAAIWAKMVEHCIAQ
jgi:hypothetical protein